MVLDGHWFFAKHNTALRTFRRNCSGAPRSLCDMALAVRTSRAYLLRNTIRALPIRSLRALWCKSSKQSKKISASAGPSERVVFQRHRQCCMKLILEVQLNSLGTELQCCMRGTKADGSSLVKSCSHCCHTLKFPHFAYRKKIRYSRHLFLSLPSFSAIFLGFTAHKAGWWVFHGFPLPRCGPARCSSTEPWLCHWPSPQVSSHGAPAGPSYRQQKMERETNIHYGYLWITMAYSFFIPNMYYFWNSISARARVDVSS